MEPLPSPDLIAVGEVIADLISDERGVDLASSGSFRRVLGGSVANLAVAFAHLGGRVTVAGVVGHGPTASFVITELDRHGVDASRIRRIDGESTTLAFVERGTATPAFEIVRGADRHIAGVDLQAPLLDAVGALHTSAFALSREPARGAILEAMRHVRARGGLVSIDLNFEASVWGRERGREVLARAVAAADMVKASRDDLARLFGGPVTPDDGATILHGWGARVAVVTMGRDGALYSQDGTSGHVAAEPATMVDTTGAGDAFWAGVLRATLLGAGLSAAVALGTRVAGRKVTMVGPLAEDIDADSFLGAVGSRP